MLPLLANRRRTTKAPTNPYDKSTVVSIYPRDITQKFHTLSPGRFHVPAGTYEKPSFIVVGPSSWWREIDDDSPLLEIVTSSIQVAKSIIDDYCVGMLDYDAATASPGVFFIPGQEIHNKKELFDKHPMILAKSKLKQDQWYKNLVKTGDLWWAKSNGSPLAINADMRLAAGELGIERDWTRNVQVYEMIKCVACGFMRNPEYPVCPNCKTIVDTELAQKLGLIPPGSTVEQAATAPRTNG